MVSLSRFSPLMGIEEEDEEEFEEVDKEIEDGEILESKAQGKKTQRPQTPHRGKRTTTVSSQKTARGSVVRAKDLLMAGKQGMTKKAFVRKL